MFPTETLGTNKNGQLVPIGAKRGKHCHSSRIRGNLIRPLTCSQKNIHCRGQCCNTIIFYLELVIIWHTPSFNHRATESSINSGIVETIRRKYVAAQPSLLFLRKHLDQEGCSQQLPNDHWVVLSNKLGPSNERKTCFSFEKQQQVQEGKAFISSK